MEEPKQPDPETEPELPTEETPTFAQPPTTPGGERPLGRRRTRCPASQRRLRQQDGCYPLPRRRRSSAEQLEPAPPSRQTPWRHRNGDVRDRGPRRGKRFNGSGQYYPGKDLRCASPNTVYVRFDDGDEDRQHSCRVRAQSAPAAEEPRTTSSPIWKRICRPSTSRKPAEPGSRPSRSQAAGAGVRHRRSRGSKV